MRSASRVCLCFLAGALVASLADRESPPGNELDGIVVDEVAPGSEIEKSGLRPGDVLRRWERLPSPPANPELAQGLFASPFDWMWLEVEQAHRGLVVLHGERNGKPRVWRVASGEWNVHFNSERRGRSRTRPALASHELALYKRGQSQIRRRRLMEGTRIWRQLVRQVPEGPVRCWLLLRAGEAWGESGHWAQARGAFEEAARWSRSDRTRVFLWEAIGKSQEYQGRFRKAANSYQAGLSIRRATEPGGLGVGRSLHQIASQENNLGNLDGAEERFDQALTLRSRWAPGSFLEADSLQAQGVIATERADLELAEHFLKRAVAIQERLAPNSFWMAFKLQNLGDVYALRGDLAVAAHHFERALEIRQRLVPDGESVAIALTQLGRLKRDQGKLKEGRDLIERALAILQRVFPQHPMVPAILNDLGDVALAARDPDRAESHYRHALALFAAISPERPWTAHSWNGLAEVATRREDWKDAVAYHQKALAIYRNVAAGTDGEARTLAGLGRIAWHAGDLEQASRRLHEAIWALEAQVGRLGGSEEVKADFRSFRRRVYFDGAAIEMELGRNEQAFNVQESARAQGFLRLLAARDLSVSGGIPPELELKRRQAGHRFRQALSALSSISPTQDTTTEKASRELPILREQLESISQQIRKLSPHATALHFPQPLRSDEVARELDEGMKVVAYQVGETTTQVFVLSRDGQVAALSLPQGIGELQREVKRFHAALESRRDGERVLDLLLRLYRSVLQPIEPLLSDADRLLILPDGPLHAVPWAALVREDAEQEPRARGGRQFLVEWKPLTVALSATVWAELKRSRTKLNPSAAGGKNAPANRAPPMVAFGDPILPSAFPDSEPPLARARLAGAYRRGLSFSPLPFSRREVEGIARLFPGQLAAFLGSEATEERAKSLPRSTRVVHFATHGFVDERLPMSSGLVLAIPANLDEPGEDGFLQAWEIFERVRLDADLVVLSACDTARGKDLGGEGLLSLTRAFQFAGARVVVASLWKVPDEGSADLMLRFYRHLKSGAAAADALRKAQLEMIAEIPWVQDESQLERRKNFSKDLVWAAFQVFGDWQ